jgi:hypothetical protein
MVEVKVNVLVFLFIWKLPMGAEAETLFIISITNFFLKEIVG